MGRASLPLLDRAAASQQALAASASGSRAACFAPTGHALRNLERVAVAASVGEPALLVGETGTGKTTLVQQLARQVRARGVVHGALASEWACEPALRFERPCVCMCPIR